MSAPSETPERRRARYLRLAAEAEELSKRCRAAGLREAYVALARSWTVLARDVSRISVIGDDEGSGL